MIAMSMSMDRGETREEEKENFKEEMEKDKGHPIRQLEEHMKERPDPST